jgi:ribosomal protein S11
MGRALISAVDGKYIRMKPLKWASGGGMVFRKDRKDPKSQFTITYARSMSGPYISYEGVKGQ